MTAYWPGGRGPESAEGVKSGVGAAGPVAPREASPTWARAVGPGAAGGGQAGPTRYKNLCGFLPRNLYLEKYFNSRLNEHAYLDCSGPEHAYIDCSGLVRSYIRQNGGIRSDRFTPARLLLIVGAYNAAQAADGETLFGHEESEGFPSIAIGGSYHVKELKVT
jgi:hypothetical protein